MILRLRVSSDFKFWPTAHSHGWCELPPFDLVKDRSELHRVFELPGGRAFVATITQPGQSLLRVAIPQTRLMKSELQSLKVQVRTCLRLEEDFTPFYAQASRHPSFRWVARIGAGRLLRAPTVFEDVVKMICTTNCSWALTVIMVENLCRKLGKEVDDKRWTFPGPAAIAECSERYLRKEIRVGYRAPYLLELSRRIARGSFDIEGWRSSDLPTAELFDLVRSVKGVGPYAAGNILKLLGRYDYLAIDSWCRKKFFEIHRNGRTTTDKVIERHYEPYGQWRGLFFWMDVTKHWYGKVFPF